MCLCLLFVRLRRAGIGLYILTYNAEAAGNRNLLNCVFPLFNPQGGHRALLPGP
jgi:hypothetical protein